MTEKKWQERYGIKNRGKISSRSEVCKRAVNMADGMCLNKLPRTMIQEQIELLLDNDAFMYARHGLALARVAEDLAYIVFQMLWIGVERAMQSERSSTSSKRSRARRAS